MMERGDPILCEEFSYFYMLDSVITAAGYKVLPVAMDEHGMKPEHLNQVELLILCTKQRQSFMTRLSASCWLHSGPGAWPGSTAEQLVVMNPKMVCVSCL